MAQLEFRNITKKFGSTVALNDVSYTIKDGEFFVLLGASGAGKSTTINVFCGLENPEQGKVLVDGQDITSKFPQERNIATAFESYALYPHFTVFQNLMFPLEAPLRKKEMTKAQREARVQEIAELLSISELMGRYPRELSGGQKQRVALGRTLVRKPTAYMLDEPIAHLDAKLRHRMRSELKKIQQTMGITTLYATPDQLEALSMGDTIAVMNKGVLEQIGTADEIYYKPVNTYVATFVGDPPMNIFGADFQGDHIIVECDTPFKISLSARDTQLLADKAGSCQLKVGIRPKDIRLTTPDDPAANTIAEVSMIDTLGQTSIVVTKVKTSEIRLKVNSDSLPKINTQVGLVMDQEQFYYFDAGTTLRIG